jgi:hypothetical protein
MGSVPAHHIAMWNGSNWAALGLGTTATGNGVDAPVYALALLGGELYIGGVFTNAYNDVGSGVPASRVARWNGSNWSVLGGGMVSNGNGVSNAVYALAVNGPSLYVGGAFTLAYNNVGSNVACKNMAVWNGSGWAALGNVPGTGVAAVSAASATAVRNLMFLGNNLYVGGYFAYAHGTSGPPISISNVAVWDGTNWGRLARAPGLSSERRLTKSWVWRMRMAKFTLAGNSRPQAAGWPMPLEFIPLTAARASV